MAQTREVVFRPNVYEVQTLEQAKQITVTAEQGTLYVAIALTLMETNASEPLRYESEPTAQAPALRGGPRRNGWAHWRDDWRFTRWKVVESDVGR